MERTQGSGETKANLRGKAALSVFSLEKLKNLNQCFFRALGDG